MNCMNVSTFKTVKIILPFWSPIYFCFVWRTWLKKTSMSPFLVQVLLWLWAKKFQIFWEPGSNWYLSRWCRKKNHSILLILLTKWKPSEEFSQKKEIHPAQETNDNLLVSFTAVLLLSIFCNCLCNFILNS